VFEALNACAFAIANVMAGCVEDKRPMEAELTLAQLRRIDCNTDDLIEGNVLSRRLGHTSVKTTERYLHELSEVEAAAQVAKPQRRKA
jgi:integrase